MNNLRKIRKEHNINQTNLAKIINVQQNTISNWETGRSEIDNESLFKLARYFNVSIDYLIGNEKSIKQQTYLSDDERRLLDLFNSFTPPLKKYALESLEHLYKIYKG